jgi:hypothetical protein
MLTDKLKEVIKEVDDPRFPLEIHRFIEQRFEEKEAEIKEMKKRTEEAEEKWRQV